MTLILPRDIQNKFERRWSARVTQAESFQAGTDRLKQNHEAVVEGTATVEIEPTLQARETLAKRN
jgi:hypothetical protein